MTATIARPRFSNQTYTELITEVQSVLVRNVDSMLAAGELFGEMLKHEDAKRVAQDVDFTPNAVARIAGVAKFWGRVRIAPDRSGRQASYGMYDRVAHDPLMTRDEKSEIKKHARRGRHIVEQLIVEYRARHSSGRTTDRVATVVNRLRALVARIESVEQLSEAQLTELRELAKQLTRQLHRLDRG